MADNNYIGVAMGLDVSDLKAGIAEANKQIQLANSKFKAAASGMDDWSKSTEGLTAKVEQLDSVLKMQQSKLAGLKAEHAKVAAEQGENSEAARRLQIQINNQQAVVNKTEKEFKNYSETLKRAEAGEIDLNEVTLKAGKAIEKAGKQSKSAADDVEELGEKAEEASDGFTVAKGAVAGFIANGLTALVGAAKDGISSLLGLGESTRELRSSMAKLETGFTTAGHSAEAAEQTYRELYGVLGDEGQATEAAAHIASLAKNQEDLSTWTNIATGVYAKFGASLPIEGLAEAANETSKTGTVTGNLADALNWAAKEGETFGVKLKANTEENKEWNKAVEEATTAEEYFNLALQECSTEQERQQLIADTLNGIYSEQADKYREVNGEVIAANEAQAEYADTVAQFGEKVEPITTSIKNGFNDILQAVLDLIGGADFEGLKESIDAGFKNFIDKVLPKIVDGFKWIIDNKDTLIAGIVGIGTAMAVMNVANMIMGVVKAFKAFKAANEGATVAQWLLNAAMSANPIGLVVAAIAGLVAAFVVLWNKSEGFRNFFIGMWEGIKNAVGVVVDWVKENWQSLLLFLVNPVAGIFKYLYDNFEGFREVVDNVVTAVKEFFSNLWSSITSGAQAAWNWIVGIFSTIGTWFNENVIQPIWNFIYPFIHNAIVLITGTWELIKAVFSLVAEWFNTNVIQPVAEFFTNLWNGITEAAQAAWDFIVGVFTAVATWFDTNVIQPVAEFFTGMWDGLKEGAKNAWQGIKDTFSKVASFFGDIFSEAWQKVKDIFSTGGKVFDGIKDGIADAFKEIVNFLIRGINKVVSVPFDGINWLLGKIKNVSVAGIKPFENLISDISIPEIPELARGGVLKRGQVGLLEGDGAEAVVPLERNLGWIKKIAAELADSLDISSVKANAAALAYSSRGVGSPATAARGGAVVDARMTVNYNGSLSRKQLKQLENDNYTAIKMKLKAEGAI